MTVLAVEKEVTKEGHPYRLKFIFNFVVKYVSPVFILIILLSSIANVMGWIKM